MEREGERMEEEEREGCKGDSSVEYKEKKAGREDIGNRGIQREDGKKLLEIITREKQ